MVGRVGKVLQNQVDDVGDLFGNRFAKTHSAVYNNAAVSEVQDLQVLEVVQIGLEVRDQL